MNQYTCKKTKPIRVRRAVLWLAGAALTATGLAGCMTTEQMAPIAGNVLDPTIYTAREFATFDRGRDIYLRQCSSCHSIEPIDRYSLSEWNKIIPPMAVESNLTLNETQILTDYILTVRQVMPVDK